MESIDVRHWRFTLGDAPEAWAKGYDDSAWRAVTVPHDWSVAEPFAEQHSSGTGYLPGGIGWYRAHLPLSALGDLAGKHLRLRFHGVYKHARVWVNGYHLGGRPSGYAEFSFDLTEILSYITGDEVVISVRVDHTDISDSRWYNGSGITRRVEIEMHRQVRLAPNGTSFTTPRADAAEAEIRIVQALVNDTAQPIEVQAHHRLQSLATGRVHPFASYAVVPAGGSALAETSVHLPEPELWSDTSPSLYRLTTSLNWIEDGTERSSIYEEIVGIRTFAFDADRGFFINGVPRKLKGVCLHEDAGPFGTAVPSDVWLRRLLKLKTMGCNAIRMAHNPHAPELYRLCDLLGFFVIDEAFDEWENPKNKWWQGHNVYPPRHQGYAMDFHEWHERDLVGMIDAHRNHASIIAWSIGNEIDYPNDPYASARFEAMTGNNDANKSARQRAYDPSRPDARRLASIARKLAAIVKAADPSRPVTVGAAFPELSRHTGFLDAIDLVGYNYKEHLYEADHAQYPAQPIVGSENWHRHSDWLAVAENDYISGQFLWTGIDYLGETHGWPRHGSEAGLLTVAGNEKHSYHLRRSWWADEPVAYLATRPFADTEDKSFWSHPISRQWPDGSAGQIEVVCFSNGEPRLTRNGAEIALTHDAPSGYWVAVTTPDAAPLLLETRRDGAVAASDTFGPRGPAIRIDASVWQVPAGLADRLAAVGLDGDPVVQVECVLRDATGEIAANDLVVTAEVSGGELLGVESGDLADSSAYGASRQSFDGRLIVFIRPGVTTTLQLTAPGLPPVTLTL